MSKRRGRGEGSITQRADGRWMARVDLGWQNGKRKYKALYGRTRAAVATKLNKALTDAQDNRPLPNDQVTVSKFLSDWLKLSVTPSVRPKTLLSYTQLVTQHLVPGLGHHRLTKLTAEMVQRFLNEKSASGLSPRTVQYLRAVLRRALGQAMKWSMVTQNVATLTNPPRLAPKQVQVLTPEQAQIFLTAIKTHRLAALVSVALACGLRQGEALGLRWSDVNLEKGELHVRHALQTMGKTRVIVETKTAQSRRTIIMPAIVVSALRRHRQRQLKQRLLAGAKWMNLGFVFTTRTGRPLDGCNVTRDFQRLLKNAKDAKGKDAKLPILPFHNLRHSCASFLLAQGVTPRAVMEILGHSEIRLTLGLYAHMLPQEQNEAAKKMNALLGGKV